MIHSNLPSLLISIKEGVIDLGWGHPSPRLHPTEDVRIASEKLLSRGDPEPLQYGAAQGFGPFLESLGSFLSDQPAYGQKVDPSNLFLTAGASQGLDLACTLLAKAGDTVIVEEPTYFVIEKIFRDHGLQIVGVPTDSDGMKTSVLQKQLENGLRPKIIYTIPVYQNPSGNSMSRKRKEDLVRLANEFNFHILADEVYQLIHFNNLPPNSLMTFDENNRVISFGSFSKILAPGLRTGWIHSSRKNVEMFSNAPITFSGGGFNHYVSALIREVIDMGLLTANIDTLRKVYAGRASTMEKALKLYFKGVIDFDVPEGGYYYWVRFLDGLNTEEFLKFAEAEGVSYRPGNVFSESGKFTNYLRLTYTLFESEELHEGVSRLATAYRKL